MILEQRGSTCGIYALLNGLLVEHELSLEATTVDEAVAELIRRTSYVGRANAGETLVGEFFSCAALANYLNHYQGELATALNLPTYTVHIVPATQLWTRQDGFYIVPGIRKRKWYERQRNAALHWMTAMPDGRVLNSAYASVQQMTRAELETFHGGLDERHFSWPRWRRQNSDCLDDEAVIVPTSREMLALEQSIEAFTCDVSFTCGDILYVSNQLD